MSEHKSPQIHSRTSQSTQGRHLRSTPTGSDIVPALECGVHDAYVPGCSTCIKLDQLLLEECLELVDAGLLGNSVTNPTSCDHKAHTPDLNEVGNNSPMRSN